MKTYQFARIQARSYPTLAEVRNPFIYGRAGCVVNVSEKGYPKELRKELDLHGLQLWHFPLVETGTDMGIENILQSVRILEKADREGIPVIVHCGFGNNRSRVVVECFHFRKMGFQLEDEYKGAKNHLAYNCGIGLLPPIEEVERMLAEL